MLQNVIDVETHAYAAAHDLQNSAALLFFDFAAAFPSVARHFIWIALEAIRVPKFIISALKMLYTNNVHFMQGTSGLMFAFVAKSGVRSWVGSESGFGREGGREGLYEYIKPR